MKARHQVRAALSAAAGVPLYESESDVADNKHIEDTSLRFQVQGY